MFLKGYRSAYIPLGETELVSLGGLFIVHLLFIVELRSQLLNPSIILFSRSFSNLTILAEKTNLSDLQLVKFR